MDIQLDLRVVELLCARLCHDVIGPVAAINNGVELVTEFGDEMQGEALGLIGDSATKAAGLIQLYRVAFGPPRVGDGTGAGFDEARALAIKALAGDRIVIEWPQRAGGATGDATEGDQGVGESKLALKLVINMVILAVEVLPGSGEVAVKIEPGAPGRVEITARKEGISLGQDFREVLDDGGSIDDLTPRTVLAYLTRVLAGAAGAGLVVECGDGFISFKADISA